MHHPGPPRFIAAGDEVELAPRDPDPTASYHWQLIQQPDGSAVTLGDDPVEHLVPDEPGTYVARLTAPDGEHELTIRAYPSSYSPSGGGQRSGMSGARSGSGFSGRSGPQRSGSGSGSGRTEATEAGAGGRPRLTLEASIEDDEAVVRANPRPHPGGTETASDLDVEFLIDDRDDVDESVVTTGHREMRISVEALPDRTRVYATAIGEHGYSVPDAVEFTRTDGTDSGDQITTADPYNPPEWAENSTVYEIYTRTFTDDEAETTFDSIAERLDYIESLGTDIIWLTPVLENDHAPHGYNITDFFDIAADLGEQEDYERFVEEAHDRDIQVLFDLVCNHSARTHPYFQDAVENPDGEYREWYEWRTETEPETYFDWEHIANFNFDHLPVRRHLIDAVDKWAPLVDGFRCDMAWAVPNTFWRELHDRVKAMDSEFLLLDETIPYIPDFQAGMFDMHFDSMIYHILREIGRGQPAERLVDAIENRAEAGFPEYAGFLLYTENHDETRYIVECGRDAAKAAAAAVFTLPGSPLVYAGQEFGQRGKRDSLAWEHADETLQDYFRTLAAVRHDQPALSGSADFVETANEVHDGWADRVVTYGRTTGDDSVVVVLHFGEETVTVDVPAATDTTDLVSGESVAADSGAGQTTVAVETVAVLPSTAENLGQ
jgi:glycosidase